MCHIVVVQKCNSEMYVVIHKGDIFFKRICMFDDSTEKSLFLLKMFRGLKPCLWVMYKHAPFHIELYSLMHWKIDENPLHFQAKN